MPVRAANTARAGHLSSPLVIAGVALGLRLLAMVLLGRPGEMDAGQASSWAQEQGGVARALLRGEGLADPFGHGTGPTAWCGPVYPAFLALVIHLAGGVGYAAALAVALVHVALAAAITYLLVQLGAALGRPRLGVLAGWTWAVHPGAIYFPIDLVWDSVFVAFGVTWLLLASARAGPRANARALVRLGFGFGVLLLLNPVPVALLPALLWYFGAGRGVAGGARATLALTVPAALILSPWCARNLVAIGTPMPRANFGVELWVGNAERADGGYWSRAHPNSSRPEFERYRELGELGYGADCMQRFRERLRDDPGRILRLTLVRARNFWLGWSPFEDVPLRTGGSRPRDGLAWVKWFVHLLFGAGALAGALLYRDPRRGAVLLSGAWLLYPVVYYVTHVMERYRFPIEPVATYLTAAVLLSVYDRLRGRAARDPQEPVSGAQLPGAPSPPSE